MLCFDAVPDAVEAHMTNRPGGQFLACGKCGQAPTGASVADAVADATGTRLRDRSLAREKLLATLGA